ncbi:glucosaminidase domain-containing protein [Acidipila sp. EB88]|uniref:glucosaminidase domain-containing protein n=1 Tax=Acidipila sp. EB88 TaxID=2305226 RepID=UPI000F5EC729|nr:glucosaminidase domain-containing protein [Acidipila sp. EB88]RRA48923.1 mannosyl-glycoprotein endo-beta-N-acetylglucosamidase [Acidipila sp. EB88]
MPDQSSITSTEFLAKATAAARAAAHIFPEYAACEAALESAWGGSTLAVRANNLFGQKQAHPPAGPSLQLETREFLHGQWVMVPAAWMMFDDWTHCFRERMALLHELARAYPHYGAALAASSGEQFVREVSASWSTDPQRAGKVLSVYQRHFAQGAPQQRLA